MSPAFKSAYQKLSLFSDLVNVHSADEKCVYFRTQIMHCLFMCYLCRLTLWHRYWACHTFDMTPEMLDTVAEDKTFHILYCSVPFLYCCHSELFVFFLVATVECICLWSCSLHVLLFHVLLYSLPEFGLWQFPVCSVRFDSLSSLSNWTQSCPWSCCFQMHQVHSPCFFFLPQFCHVLLIGGWACHRMCPKLMSLKHCFS